MSDKSSLDPFEKWSEKSLLTGLFIFNFLLKIALIGINRAEYTDGILQITLFSNPNRLYPPLFTILVHILTPIFRNPELAGRFISVLSGSLLAIPVFLLTRRIFDKTAAFFAGVVFTVSPMALRWSLHSMTDMIFALIFFLAVSSWIHAAADSRKDSRKAFTAATVLAVLATLTRYQGVLLAPPILFLLVMISMRQRRFPWKETAWQILWALPVLWIYFYGFRHPQQFVERAGNSPGQTVILILNVFESFLAYSPYFLTLPVFFFMLAGLFYPGGYRNERAILLGIFLYMVTSLLLLQSAFSSFQSRYLLPLLPMAAVFAGRGMAALKIFWKRRPLVFNILFIVTILYGIGFGLTSVFLQRETFGDLKEAALFLRELPHGVKIYSNETYKDLGPVKMRFWSKRDIESFDVSRDFPSGAFVCFSSAYGGFQSFEEYNLKFKYRANLLRTYGAEIVPLLPDVMQEPYSHQNPLAMTFRYTTQYFITAIYKIP
ncbi:glycosyltransferase family 39 protein [Candidatus Sumerlaeota bacterium]|nr:glycosyltransferase family 39 protein [Candidatus Sumerlaeota bacterium]